LNAGGHYNPLNKNHGDLNAAIRHEGDFGNIEANSNGTATISITKAGTNLTAMINR
jgi:Cu-Zn family superoxide dismutase